MQIECDRERKGVLVFHRTLILNMYELRHSTLQKDLESKAPPFKFTHVNINNELFDIILQDISLL